MDRNFVQNYNDIQYNEDLKSYNSLGEFKDDYSTKEEKKLIFFNSKDIDYLADDTTYNFSINFSPNSTLASLNKNFKNIKKIKLLNLTIRDAYVNLSQLNGLYSQDIINSYDVSVNSNSINPRLERLSDLPYLILELTDINQLNYGTNNDINKSSFILKYDDDKDIRNNTGEYTFNSNNNYTEFGNINNSIYGDTNNKMLYYINYGELDMDYTPTPKSLLNNMRFSLKTPYGETIKKQQNYLTVIKIENSSNMIKFYTSEYFSPEEYSLGDRVIFKNFVSNLETNGRKYDIETFINRNEGHNIIQHGDNLANTKLYKSFFIPFNYTLSLNSTISSAANTFIVDNYSLSASDESCSGTLINASQQIFLSLEITYETRDNSVLHSNII